MPSSQQLVKLALILAAVVALAYIVNMYNKKAEKKSQEKFEGEKVPSAGVSGFPVNAASAAAVEPSDAQAGPYRSVEGAAKDASKPGDCFPADRLTAEDLLPKDAANSKWAEVNPAGAGELKDKNFLTAGYHIGLNTVGSSLRNANLQLRSEPANPQVLVSPWLQTTIENSGTNHRTLEIGN